MKLQSYSTIIYSVSSHDTLGIPQLLTAKLHKVEQEGKSLEQFCLYKEQKETEIKTHKRVPMQEGYKIHKRNS